jgi:glycerate dehydrogenase
LFEYPNTATDDLIPRLQGASLAVTNRALIGDDQLSQLPDLRLIAVSATGYDCIDVAACRRHNVLVTNLQDWSTTAVAEHAFALLLALRRQLFLYRPLVASGAWQRSTFYGLLENPIPGDLFGATLGIIGHGNLGQRVATLGGAFGMTALIAERKGVPARPGRTSFDDVLTRSDVLCITCPFTPETAGLIGASELARMKPTALLINCARGRIVDDAALADALRNGRLGGAGLDVLAQEPPTQGNPLLDLDLPNLIVTPHMAFASEVALGNLAEQLIANIESFLAGHPRNVVS